MRQNLQPSTFNGECSNDPRRGRLLKGWALPVEGLAFAFFVAPVFGQTNTNHVIPALNPPYGELPPSFWEQYGTLVVVAGFGALVLIGLAFWLCLRSRPAVVLPPAAEARRALDGLRSRPEDGVLLSEVSAIVQKYFIAAFALAPGEFTTTEFCEAMARHEPIGGELSSAAAGFLRQCDERKFSPANPAAPLNAVAGALELVILAEARQNRPQPPAQLQPPPAASTVR